MENLMNDFYREKYKFLVITMIIKTLSLQQFN